MQKFSYNSIGTTLSIHIESSKNLSHLFDEIVIFLDFFEKKFSRFIPDNWLFHLNKNKTAKLDIHAFSMLETIQKLARETQWYFDPTIGKRLQELGYGNQEIFFSAEAFNHRNFDEICRFNQEKIEIFGNAELEFGGIGKWYAIDWIFDFLEKNLQNSENFLINFGGDMACRGKWKIALESPFSDDEAIGILDLENSFLACSAGNKRKFWNSHHLINPFNGKSSSDIVATFIHTSCKTPFGWMITDGFATALSVMNLEKSCEILTKNPYIEGLLIWKNGNFFLSEKSSIQLF